jgi:glycosyltransferase involved in cell wall biosynthesis
LTRQCLAALARHTDLARSEVITVDDGSTDATPQLLAAPPFPLIAVRQTTNSASLRPATGAAVARGDYLVFFE